MRGRGYRRGQALALPPVCTCQITCISPKVPFRHDEQAECVALLIPPGVEHWEVTCLQVVLKQDLRACKAPAQMIVTPDHQRRTHRHADRPLSEQICCCEFSECLHAGCDVTPQTRLDKNYMEAKGLRHYQTPGLQPCHAYHTVGASGADCTVQYARCIRALWKASMLDATCTRALKDCWPCYNKGKLSEGCTYSPCSACHAA